MAKTKKPAFSQSASGSIGDLVFDKRGYVRSKPKKSTKPQTPARGNVQQSFGAARKAVKVAGPTIEQAVRTNQYIKQKKKYQQKYFQPGYWATYLASELPGPNRRWFIEHSNTYTNLPSSAQQQWDKAAHVIGLQHFQVPHASEPPISAGLQLYWLASRLPSLGIYPGLEAPNAHNAPFWAATITETDINTITQAINNLKNIPQPTNHQTTPSKTKQKHPTPPTQQPPHIQPNPLTTAHLNQTNNPIQNNPPPTNTNPYTSNHLAPGNHLPHQIPQHHLPPQWNNNNHLPTHPTTLPSLPTPPQTTPPTPPMSLTHYPLSIVNYPLSIAKQPTIFILTLILILTTACGNIALPQNQNTTNHQNIPPTINTPPNIFSTKDTQANLLKTPTATPTPTSPPTLSQPTVISIAPQNLITTNTLAEGLKIIYIETNGSTGEANFWMSNVTNLAKRRLLTQVKYKPRYTPSGNISPDRRKLLYSVIPPNTPSNQTNREIWVLDMETLTSIKVIESVNGFAKWLSDSKTIVYSKQVYIDKINGKMNLQIYTINTNTLQETFVTLLNDFITPLTFPNTNSLFYVAGDELTELDFISAKNSISQKINVSGYWDRYAISPDRKFILISKLNKDANPKKYEVIIVSLENGQMNTILTTPYITGNNPIYHFNFKWSLDSQHFLLFVPPQVNSLPHIELWENNRNQISDTFLTNASFLNQNANTNYFDSSLLLGHWSPDSNWLTLNHYPQASREVYLLEISSNTMTRIPVAEDLWGIRVIGWY